MTHLIAALLIVLVPFSVHAANLADLIEKQIERKTAEVRKDDPVPQPAATQASVTTMSPSSLRDELRADDIQLYGVIGVGEALTAKLRVKDAQITRQTGQRIQGGWTLTRLTPNSATFELIRTTKVGGKAVEKTVASKEVFLSAANASTSTTAGSMPSGAPPQLKVPQ
jgi:hypothetical protein